MNRRRMTSAASALLRALVDRSGPERNRILLSDWTSVDWNSLTFAGERHCAGFVFQGPDAPALASQWADGLPDAEWDIGSSGFVAEIALSAPPETREDGSVLVQIEALTIAD
jgi:hypothetical protein